MKMGALNYGPDLVSMVNNTVWKLNPGTKMKMGALNYGLDLVSIQYGT